MLQSTVFMRKFFAYLDMPDFVLSLARHNTIAQQVIYAKNDRKELKKWQIVLSYNVCRLLASSKRCNI